MFRAYSWFFLALGLTGIAGAVGPGCATQVISQPGGIETTSSAGGATSASGPTVAGPTATTGGPTGPSAGVGGETMCGPFEGKVFAVDELYLGDRTFDGVKSSVAWKELGFNLDGLVTTNDYSKHCKPYPGGTADKFEDGVNGYDNSFGRNIRPIFQDLIGASVDDQANKAINSGIFTVIFAFDKLANGGDQDPVVTKVYGGGDLGAVPKWTGNDCWPVLYESLYAGGDISSANVVFPKATLVNDTWDSNGKVEFVLPLDVQGVQVPVHVYGARATVQLSDQHDAGIKGQIGGYVKTEEFIATVKAAVAAVNPSYCGLFNTLIADQIRRASDIGDDGTQNPNSTCNAITVGIGFTLAPVAFGKIAPPTSPSPSQCP